MTRPRFCLVVILGPPVNEKVPKNTDYSLSSQRRSGYLSEANGSSSLVLSNRGSGEPGSHAAHVPPPREAVPGWDLGFTAQGRVLQCVHSPGAYDRNLFGKKPTETGRRLNYLRRPESPRPAYSLLPAEKQSRNTWCRRWAKPRMVGAKNMASSSGCAVTRSVRLPPPGRPACSGLVTRSQEPQTQRTPHTRTVAARHRSGAATSMPPEEKLRLRRPGGCRRGRLRRENRARGNPVPSVSPSRWSRQRPEALSVGLCARTRKPPRSSSRALATLRGLYKLSWLLRFRAERPPCRPHST